MIVDFIDIIACRTEYCALIEILGIANIVLETRLDLGNDIVHQIVHRGKCVPKPSRICGIAKGKDLGNKTPELVPRLTDSGILKTDLPLAIVF